MSRRPEHAASFRGIADAFAVASRRRQDQTFGRYDGWLEDRNAVERIAQRFGPDHTFSPSQLESFALCPFQFYQRYVLGLKLVDDREELGEDYAGRGEDVHHVLEQIHAQIAAEGESNLIERLGVLIESQMRVELEQYDGEPTDVAAVLDEIGTRRTKKMLSRYVGQFESYQRTQAQGARPAEFEVVFGASVESTTLPKLILGEGPELVRLEGKIDRVDLIEVDGKIRFRVIDYKTGSNPTVAEVRDGLASQLPLYALAVESLVYPEGDHTLADFGYWSLRGDGFKPVRLKDDWDVYRVKLMEFVLKLVANLRRGVFPVESLKAECWKRCDYQAVCRVKEVRMIGKTWRDRPDLGARS
jgi:RecB family exonuclease